MKKILTDVLLLVSALILFILAHPNVLVVNGIPFFAYFFLIPIFILIKRLSFKTVWLYGFLYGFLCYAFYAYWLISFHTLGLQVIASLFGLQYAVLFVVLKFVSKYFIKHSWIAMWIIWCGYEYLRTLGFLGFSYGSIAYTQWQVLPLIQIVDIVGVWGICAFVTYPSALLSKMVYPLFENKEQKSISFLPFLKLSATKHLVAIIAYGIVFVLVLVYGLISQKDYSSYEHKTVALIQPNSDPWEGGTAGYKQDLNTLKNLTDAALRVDDTIDFVVWPETSFVPSIRYHYKHRTDRTRLELVFNLLEYINSKQIPFVIGNGDTSEGYTQTGAFDTISYNSAFLFRPAENVLPPNPDIYNKMHLVPFAEHFPYDNIFPWFNNLLLEHDTHFWQAGDEAVVFEIDGLKCSTPICFEDTFGYIGRRFVQKGAQVFVNLSNDSWANSVVCQYQHLSMAVFRSIENRIPTIRSTASGQTAIIDPNGKVVSMAEPFEETFLVGSFPVVDKTDTTLYTKYGDYLGIVFIVLTCLIIACTIFNFVVYKYRG